MAFGDIAPRLMAGLMQDYGLTQEQAAGFVGNLAHESGGFNTLQEINPLVEGSRGGYGYAQWTGPRRRQFEAWSSEHGLDPSSYDANYGFLRNELDNTAEGRVLNDLRAAPDVASASKVVEQQFLRPGIPHSESRVKWANRALGGGASPAPQPGLSSPVVPKPTPEQAAPFSMAPQVAESKGVGDYLAQLASKASDYAPPSTAPADISAPSAARQGSSMTDILAAIRKQRMQASPMPFGLFPGA